ncbi:MAG: hypothetical protein PHV73_07295 [Eubacteriales bacterium]|nr:hypothetical protein [Eubacteriales bacterium]
MTKIAMIAGVIVTSAVIAITVGITDFIATMKANTAITTTRIVNMIQYADRSNIVIIRLPRLSV